MSSSSNKADKNGRGCFEAVASAFRHQSHEAKKNLPSQLDEGDKSSLALATHVTIHQVAREGNVEMMERLLERIPQLQVRKKRLNQPDEFKLAPIHYAARYNHRHMIEYLIKNGANAQEVDEDDYTALHFLAKQIHKSISHSLAIVKKVAPLLENKKDQQLNSVELLVDGGAHVNAKDASSQTPLHVACARGNIIVVKQLLECAGLALETVDNQGMTALHLSCLNGHSNIVRLLVGVGADLRCRDKDMMTPMHVACCEGFIEVAEILFEEANKQKIKLSSSHSDTKVERENIARRRSIAALHKLTALHNNIHCELTPMLHRTPQDSTGGVVLLLDEDIEKNLPLHLAIENGHLSLARFSIEKTKAAGRGSMATSLRSNSSCLHLAVQSNSIEIVKLLLKEGADINAKNSSTVTPLYIACQQNAHEIVKLLLENGCDIETKDADYMTPFLVASRCGNLEALALLMEYNADVTATDKDDKTCLMLAAEEDKADAIRLLMTKNKIKQSIEERDRYNNTALHLSSVKGHSVTVKLLLDYQAATETRNDADQNTLHMAALHGHHAIIPDLVNRDRSIINVVDEEGNTVLHLAAIGGNIKCVSTLIQLGANLSLRNAQQWTALDCACALGFVKPARAMLKAGAAIASSGKIKISPLHLACQRGHVEVVELLLEWKADVTFRSIDGRNALDYAIDFGQKNCVLTLIKHSTWRDSFRNAYVHPMTGHLITPMRKLIMKMEDMAELVCNQCIEDNGKKTDDKSFEITLIYELLDDVYSLGQWIGNTDTGTHKPAITDEDHKTYDESGHVTEEAFSYHDDSGLLQKNHPLMLMVKSKCGVLLKHPVVVGLLDYKWQRFGRYVYYTNLIFFLLYLILLNVFMEYTPMFYEIDWVKMLQVRKLRAGLQNATSSYQMPVNDPLDCYYYRTDLEKLPNYSKKTGCNVLSPILKHLKWVIFILSAFNLFREILQFFGQRLAYLNVMNGITVILYLLTFFLTFDFMPYRLHNLAELTNHVVNNSEMKYLESVQLQTDLRQEWQQELGAFSIFLSWMVLLLFIQKLPMFGIFVVMFTDVLKTFLQFSIVLFLFILGFALTFNIALGNQYVFSHWFWSATTTVAMMVGEINYETIFFSTRDLRFINYFQMVYSKGLSAIIFVIFIVVMTIIIMNLLVGLAVGDIMEVQENASLERFRMQVDLALEVEFTLPEFLRRKLCLGKQNIQINKYRKSNALIRFLFENSELTLERISKYLDKEVADQGSDLSNMDSMITCLDGLRNRVNDLLSEISDIKQDLRDARGKVTEVQSEARMHAKNINVNVMSTSDVLSARIQQANSDQIEKTQRESIQTRDEVDDTKTGVASLLEDVEKSRKQTQDLILATEERLKSQQEALIHRHWENLESTLTKYHDTVEKGRRAVMERIEDMQISFVKKGYM